MTWREFQLRKAGYEREQLKNWEHTRMVAYWSGAGTAFDGKKTTIDKFLPLGNDTDKLKVSDEHRESFNKAMQDYKDKVKNKNVNS
jgi:hypothetical protein